MDQANNKKISCIIPVFNESERVLGVLNAVVGHELVDEVIVINDGSTDNTKQVLAGVAGINFISLDKNHGKSYAVMTGLKTARNSLIMMIDSDLLGLTKEAISELANPVLENKADVAMSLRKNSLPIYKLLGCDFFSGERVFYKSILGDLDQIQNLKGFLLESYFNKIMIAKKLRLKNVYLENVITPRKSAKAGFWQGSYDDWKMVSLIVSYLGLIGTVNMAWGMLRLKV
jgi:glycosyltransferase involved in cell wall biosynthesis